jgi:hypothetical protein
LTVLARVAAVLAGPRLIHIALALILLIWIRLTLAALLLAGLLAGLILVPVVILWTIRHC